MYLGIFGPIWETAAEVLGWTYLVVVSLLLLWFGTMNFIVDEKYHPLDFYSNLLRTRPFWYILIFVFFASVFASALLSEHAFGFLVGAFPELAVAMYLQGLIAVGGLLRRESTAAALAGALLYSLTATATALMVTIPDLPVERPGAIYASFFLLANIVWVVWVSEGVGRHVVNEGNPRLLPDGAECVPKRFMRTTLWGNPVLLIVLNFWFGVLWQIEIQSYGTALCFIYILVASGLVLGCCYNYRAGTEFEEVEET